MVGQRRQDLCLWPVPKIATDGWDPGSAPPWSSVTLDKCPSHPRSEFLIWYNDGMRLNEL